MSPPIDAPFTKDPVTVTLFLLSAISSLVMALAVAVMNGLRPFRLSRSGVKNIMSPTERLLGVLYALGLLVLEVAGVQAGFWLSAEWLLPSHKWVLAYMSVKLLCFMCYFVALWSRTSFRHFLLMPFGIFTGFFAGMVLTEILEDAADASTGVFAIFTIFSLVAYAVPPTAIMINKINTEMSREDTDNYVVGATPIDVEVDMEPEIDAFGNPLATPVVRMSEVKSRGDPLSTTPPNERFSPAWDFQDGDDDD